MIKKEAYRRDTIAWSRYIPGVSGESYPVEVMEARLLQVGNIEKLDLKDIFWVACNTKNQDAARKILAIPNLKEKLLVYYDRPDADKWQQLEIHQDIDETIERLHQLLAPKSPTLGEKIKKRVREVRSAVTKWRGKSK